MCSVICEKQWASRGLQTRATLHSHRHHHHHGAPTHISNLAPPSTHPGRPSRPLCKTPTPPTPHLMSRTAPQAQPGAAQAFSWDRPDPKKQQSTFTSSSTSTDGIAPLVACPPWTMPCNTHVIPGQGNAAQFLGDQGSYQPRPKTQDPGPGSRPRSERGEVRTVWVQWRKSRWRKGEEMRHEGLRSPY